MTKLLTVYLFLVVSCITNGFAGDFSTLRNSANQASCKFEEWAPAKEGGVFIAPNEYKTNQYGDLLEKTQGGMMVSVGTFRSFITFGLGNFTYGVFADYDSNIIEFNKVLLDLMIALAGLSLSPEQQRLQFLSLLRGDGWLDEEVLQKIKDQGFKEPQKAQYLLAPDTEKYGALENVPIVIKDIVKKITRLLNNFNLSFISAQKTALYNYYIEPEEGNLSSEKFRFFWEDDSQWNKIVDAAKNNRIAVIARSVADESFYSEINNCLIQLDTKLELLDLSNIPQSSSFLKKNDKDNMINSIKLLPKTEPSFLFITSTKTYKNDQIIFITEQRNDIKWRYYYIDLSNIDLLRKM